MRLSYLFTLCAFLTTATITVQAQSNMDRLVTQTFKKQQNTEKEIVEMWINNQRGERLNEKLAEYVDQEVRLNAMTSKRRNSLLSAISKTSQKFATPNDMAKALVQEYYKRQGMIIDDTPFLKGTYHVKLKK